MDEQEAYRKLARGIIQVNIASITIGLITASLLTTFHGFFAFWISIHLTSYAIYRKYNT